MEGGKKCRRDLTIEPTVWDRGQIQSTHVCPEGHVTDLEPYFVCKPKFHVVWHSTRSKGTLQSRLG